MTHPDMIPFAGDLPTVSVVVCTYRRPHSLLRLLECLKDQAHTDFNHLEVIIVNDGSHDAGYQDSYDDYPFAVTYIARERHPEGLPRVYSSKNIGVGQAKNEVVWLLDDDIIIDDHTLLILRIYHRLWQGYKLVLRPHDANPWDPDWYQASFPINVQDWTSDKVTNYPSFAGLSLRKEAWDEVGGVDEDYDEAMGFADLDLGIRLWQKGYNITQIPGIVVYIDDRETGSHRDGFITLRGEQHRNGKLLMQKWPDEAHKYGITD